ncbi:MAG: hypothetical protein QM504_06510 [Pseudomonadota bacterium]
MNTNKDELEQLTYDLYFAIRQAESMVKLMAKAECFNTITPQSDSCDDFCHIRDTLDVCGEKLEHVHDLFETCEQHIKVLSDSVTESQATVQMVQKLKQVFEAEEMPA